MSNLLRDDGVQFSMHAYRERVGPNKSALLNMELRTLSRQHGEYMRVFKGAGGQCEAVFSKDPGYLLGETVWHYFGRPSDLLYCEALPGGKCALLVIIRGGVVYLDTKIPLHSLVEELAGLVAGNTVYEVYVAGDVPISESPEEGQFCFDSSRVSSFFRLEQPIFPVLPVDERMALQPVALALQSFESSKRSVLPMILVAVCLVGGWLFWNGLNHPSEAYGSEYVRRASSAVSPFEPGRILSELAHVEAWAHCIPGWRVTRVTFDGRAYRISVKSMGATVALLSAWAKGQHVDVHLTTEGAVLSFLTQVTRQPLSRSAADLEATVGHVVDQMQPVLMSSRIVLGDAHSNGQRLVRSMTVRFKDFSADLIALMGRRLSGLPVRLQNVVVNEQNGLLGGQLNIVALKGESG